MAVNLKIRKFGNFQRHDPHTKFYENPSTGSDVITERTDKKHTSF